MQNGFNYFSEHGIVCLVYFESIVFREYELIYAVIYSEEYHGRKNKKNY